MEIKKIITEGGGLVQVPLFRYMVVVVNTLSRLRSPSAYHEVINLLFPFFAKLIDLKSSSLLKFMQQMFCMHQNETTHKTPVNHNQTLTVITLESAGGTTPAKLRLIAMSVPREQN